MPTVIQRDGFRVVIFLPPREHGPAHVHVCKAGTEVVITLDPKEWRKRHVQATDDSGNSRTNPRRADAGRAGKKGGAPGNVRAL